MARRRNPKDEVLHVRLPSELLDRCRAEVEHVSQPQEGRATLPQTVRLLLHEALEARRATREAK